MGTIRAKKLGNFPSAFPGRFHRSEGGHMLRRTSLVTAAVVALLAVCSPSVGATAPAPGRGDERWSPPVNGPVVRGYEPPKRPFGPQHLGLDYAVPAGAPVRAAGDGVVAFAGLVGRSRAVGIEHSGGRRTTYAYLRRRVVRPGVPVRGGDVVGFSGGTGPGHGPDVVHFGYRVNGQPQDPAQLFHPEPPRISLAPLDRPACRRRAEPAVPPRA
jgi:murein DD-endopeptidase MepM/ murein hydrolase activator NlpD